MICYNVCVIGVVHIKNKLNMKLYKNNNLVLDKNNIDYLNKFDKILFEIDNYPHYLINNEDKIVFQRETEDYLFYLELTNDNKCHITLKKEQLTFPINVEDASINKDNNKLIINYQLESDDEITTIEFIL